MKKFSVKMCLVILILVFKTVNCFSEDLWKPCTGISSPSSVVKIAVSEDNVIFAASEQNLFRSADDGVSWKKIIMSDENFQTHLFWNGDMKCNKNGDLFILTEDAFYLLQKGSDIAKLIFHINFSVENRYSISFSSDSKKVVVLAGKEIWVSNNAGSTWKQINLSNESRFGLNLQSVTYDDNYGIIKNYSAGYPIQYLVYSSTDDGLIWHQLKTIPGTNFPAKEIHVFESNVWAVGSETYNFNTKKLTPTNVEKAQGYFRNSKGYYITTFSAIFFSGDSGETWNNITNDVFKGDGLGWVDAFYTGNTDILYAGTRYKQLKKSSNNGVTWERLILNNTEDIQFDRIKCVGNKIYATDHTNSYFVSADSGKSWNFLPLKNDSYFVDNFDVNSKGEMVYNEGPIINYSSNMGLTCTTLDTTGYNRVPRSMLKIFDNGVIVGRQDEFSGTFMYPSANQKGVWLNQVSAKDLYLLKDGNYLNFSWGFIQLIDKDFTTPEFITSSLSDQNGFHPSFNNFCISKDGAMYLATERGVYKSPSVSDNFKLLAYKDTNVNQIFVDNNNYLYISNGYKYSSTGQRILISKDDGKTWKEINSNLGFTNIEYFYVFGDCNLIAKSDKVYYADLKKSNVLTLTSKPNVTYFTYNSPIEINYNVKDDLGNPVESAAIILYNDVKCKYDTLYSDINGNSQYILKLDYYNLNERRDFKIYGYAVKDNYFNSCLNTRYLQYATEKFELRCNADSNYILTKPNNNISINISFMQHDEQIFRNAEGTLLIEDKFSSKTLSIPYNSVDSYQYNINIPSDADYGMYRITIKGVNIQNDTTTDYFVNLVVIDSIPNGDIWVSVKESIENAKLLIYPNPAKEYIEISSINPMLKHGVDENSEIQIFDMFGENVLKVEQTFTSVQKIDISKLSQGIFIIKIGNRVKKFVKI